MPRCVELILRAWRTDAIEPCWLHKEISASGVPTEKLDVVSGAEEGYFASFVGVGFVAPVVFLPR